MTFRYNYEAYCIAASLENLFRLLKLFLREAEQIDSGTAGQEAFLGNDDLGVSHST